MEKEINMFIDKGSLFNLNSESKLILFNLNSETCIKTLFVRYLLFNSVVKFSVNNQSAHIQLIKL